MDTEVLTAQRAIINETDREMARLFEQRMEAVREVAASLAINPNTIQRAYRELEAEGYIISVPGKGSFVSDRSDAIRARCEELKGSFRTMVRELRQTGAVENELTEIVREEFRHD